VNTVSHALRDMPDISESAKKIIKKTADEMGYIINSSARLLRSGKSRCVAIIVGDISNPHFSIMIREMEDALKNRGYSTLILNTNEDRDIELEAIKNTLSRSVDGIIICPTEGDRKNLKYIMSCSLPCVVFGRRPECEDIPYVICNDREGGYLAAKHLIAEHREGILFFNGAENISSTHDRLEGIKLAVKECGFDESRLSVSSVPITCQTQESEIAKHLPKYIKNIGIIAFSDLVAMQICHCLKSIKVDIPKQASVIGFDNIASRYPLPLMLSSVTSSKAKMSGKTVDMLLSLIENGNIGEKQIVLPTKLVLRETTIED
jgi:LacI family transcriptional regulator